jgi:hypothetical protein
MIEVPVTYTVGAGAAKKVGELIISNRPIAGHTLGSVSRVGA